MDDLAYVSLPVLSCWPSGVETFSKYIFFSNDKCAAELDGWNLEFDQNLVSYSARVLPTETIFQANGSKVSRGRGGGADGKVKV